MLYGLGRLVSEDPRDKSFPMAAILPAASERKYRYWNEGKVRINQGTVPACVGAAWVHWLLNGPIKQKPENVPSFIQVYKRAQDLDEWEGNNYAGTSVRAGAKAIQEMGFIENYFWTYYIEQLITAVLEVGPVVVGTNWYNGMSWPDAKARIKVTGRIDGGHAYLLNGVNLDREEFRIEQSWNPKWGDTGNAWISFKDMERLIGEAGEVVLATEIKK